MRSTSFQNAVGLVLCTLAVACASPAPGGQNDADATGADTSAADTTADTTADEDTANTDVVDAAAVDTTDTADDETSAADTGDPNDADVVDAGDDTAPSDTTDDVAADAGADTADTADSSADADEADAAHDADGANVPDPTCRDGVLCGPDSACCRDGSECIAGACLPACPTDVRCGADRAICCGEGEVCLADTCTLPAGPCIDAFDCPDEHFCEPTLGACLPQPDSLLCEVIPDFDAVTVEVEWSYTAAQIISIPVVGDIDGDGVPEAVVNLTQRDSLEWLGGEIVAIDGATGTVEWTIPNNPSADQYGSHGRSTIGLGDVSGDGLPDVIYAGRESSGNSRIVAVDGTGSYLWRSHNGAGGAVAFDVENGAASLANFDDDPQAEIVFGATLIDHDGRVVWNEGGQGGRYGTNAGYTGGISVIADLTGDGYPEIISGRHAWQVTRPGEGLVGATVTNLWTAAGNDGFPAVADLDGNGTPEVVLVASRTVRILDGATGELWCGVDPTGAACVANAALRTPALLIPGGSTDNIGGPPTVSDFDGDGRPEIGIAGGYSYNVYDLNRTGETIVQPAGAAAPTAGHLFVRWSQTTRDRSSNSTGSSVFDFQGDGAAEVVYADECYMRVYDGATGTVQLQVPNSSGTIHEYPLVVDIDADNNSEILIVANNTGASTNCPISGYVGRRGLFVYGDAGDGWVRTRQVWPQHAYHVTNATSDGNVPFAEVDAWTLPGLNAYRQNVQSEGTFNTPDLAVSLTLDRSYCPGFTLGLVATVTNRGSLGVRPGVSVAFYQGADATGTFLGVAETTEAILPGASTEVTFVTPLPPIAERFFFAAVDTDGAGDGEVIECIEDNNTAAASMTDCFGY